MMFIDLKEIENGLDRSILRLAKTTSEGRIAWSLLGEGWYVVQDECSDGPVIELHSKADTRVLIIDGGSTDPCILTSKRHQPAMAELETAVLSQFRRLSSLKHGLKVLEGIVDRPSVLICSSCDGTGTVEACEGVESICTDCFGTGKVPTEQQVREIGRSPYFDMIHRGRGMGGKGVERVSCEECSGLGVLDDLTSCLRCDGRGYYHRGEDSA